MVSVTNGVSWAAARVGDRAGGPRSDCPHPSPLPQAGEGICSTALFHLSACGGGILARRFHLSRLRVRSPARRVREHSKRDSRGCEPNIAAMLQRALRGEGRLAYCSSPAAPELAPSFRRLRVKIPSAPTRRSPEVSCRSPPL